MFHFRRPAPPRASDNCCGDPFLRRLRQVHEHHHRDFHRHHRNFRRFRPAVALFNILLLYLLFRWVGFEGIGLLLAALIVAKECAHFYFLQRLEKRIFEPIENLKLGIDEIANGNYNVTVRCREPNDLSLLILSFNEMAQKLHESEQLQREYEANRKALIANISHDLKTPITSIQGYVEALLDHASATAANRENYLQTIHSNAAYLNNLIDDLFLFSKLDMDKLDFSYATVPARPFMADLMEEFAFELQDKGIPFSYCDTLAATPLVRLDGKRFQQACNNIIHNALQHASHDQLKLDVTLSQDGESLVLAIRDNGPGIDPAQLPHIFDRFFRVDAERKKDCASTGLGLAIAKELIEAHGGTISAANLDGHGCCFSLRLPIAAETESEVSQ